MKFNRSDELCLTSIGSPAQILRTWIIVSDDTISDSLVPTMVMWVSMPITPTPFTTGDPDIPYIATQVRYSIVWVTTPPRALWEIIHLHEQTKVAG